jgi:hypothetical protein
MTSITVYSPIKVAVPRATRWAAGAFTGVMNWVEHHGEARAARQLQSDRLADAVAVRDYAHRFAAHDPRFAADLLAAADRHEQGK